MNDFTSCYGRNQLTTRECIECEAGTSSPGEESKTCEECKEGYFSIEEQSICLRCNEECKRCKSTNENCLSCFEGFGIDNGKCIIWESGTYSDDTSKCQKCLKETVSTKEGSTECKECIGLTFANKEGMKECLKCSDKCQECNSNNGLCTNCKIRYEFENGICSIYLEGTKYETSITKSKCLKCPIGTYSNKKGSSICFECLEMTYSSTTGTIECLPCDNKCKTCHKINGSCLNCKKGNGFNENNYSECQKGKYSNGITKCLDCSSLKYAPNEGMDKSQSCSITCKEYNPINGKYTKFLNGYELENGICSECPEGSYYNETIELNGKCKDCKYKTESEYCDTTTGECSKCDSGMK